MMIPSNVQYWMHNWNEGYKFGSRDGMMMKSYANDFSLEKHGFMTGYIHGYCAAMEKKRGFSYAQTVQSEFANKCKTRKIDGREYPPEIKFELDRSGD
jgi:hypothetical protein